MNEKQTAVNLEKDMSNVKIARSITKSVDLRSSGKGIRVP